MRALPSIVFFAAAAFLMGCGEQAASAVVVQADEPVQGDAGEEYLSLHAAMGQPFLTRVAMVEGPPDAQLVAELEANGDLIDRLAYASRMTECDWGLPEQTGVDTLLPHLGKVRALARVLNVDARRLAAAGDGDRASRRVAGLVRMARHTAEDGADSIIEWLVGIAVLAFAADAAMYCAPDFDAAQRGRVLAEFREIDLDDPYGLDAKIALDRERSAAAGLETTSEQQLQDGWARVRKDVERAIETLESGS
ncbi:MAG: hypothetical protein RIE32_10745 [Phycisphaerales bacterium]